MTDASNPGPTLEVFDAFRFVSAFDAEERLDRAVQFLLSHWTTRRPLGSCSFGIGSRFLKVEYPFLRYNTFSYVYVLSFFKKARKDRRFRDAFAVLESKTVDGMLVVENAKRGLKCLAFCEKGQPSVLATKRYRELVKNLTAK